MSGVIATIAHARAARLDGARITCARGIRAWAQRHGIDMRVALRDGVPVEVLDRINDAFARRVAAIARGAAGHD